MISEERVKHMTRMAIFEKEKGPDYQPMLKYSKKEYIALHGWGGFFAGTLFFLIIFGGIGLYYVSSVMDEPDMTLILLYIVIALLLYAAYIIVHVHRVRLKASKNYKAGKNLIKDLKDQYDKLGEMYEKEAIEATPKVIRNTMMLPDVDEEEDDIF